MSAGSIFRAEAPLGDGVVLACRRLRLTVGWSGGVAGITSVPAVVAVDDVVVVLGVSAAARRSLVCLAEAVALLEREDRCGSAFGVGVVFWSVFSSGFGDWVSDWLHKLLRLTR